MLIIRKKKTQKKLVTQNWREKPQIHLLGLFSEIDPFQFFVKLNTEI